MSCRARVSGARRHRCSRWHAELVDGYRCEREAQLQRAEAATYGHSSELADYWRDVEPPLTFRAWLIGHAGEREPAEAGE